MHYVDIHTHHTPHQASSGADSYTCIVNLIIATEGQQLPNTPNENGIYYSAGIHPWYISDPDQQMELLRHTCNLPGIVALGEAGLDTLASTPFILQEKVFRQQIALSEALCKPLVIHCVKAWQQLITLKKETAPRMPWVIHGFRGNKQLAEQLIHQDCWLSFGEKFNPEALRAAYPNRILAETDESLLSIQKIYQQLADTSGIDAQLFSNTLRENVRTVFTI